jgi:hypothetical protein
MVKIALFVVTMVKVARLGASAPYVESERIKTVLICPMIIQCLFLTLAIGIYMTKTLDRVNKLFSRNF